MPTAQQSKQTLELLADAAVADANEILYSLSGTPDAQRYALLSTVPGLIDYYSDGSSALAADFYEDERDRYVSGSFLAEPVVVDRTVKIRRAIAWASDPLFSADVEQAASRMAEVVQPEVVRPYRDTILANRRRDPASVGWMRLASPKACGFCKFLADRGAVYRKDTARFAAHENCMCTAVPVFDGSHVGPEASALQYVASKRKRTAAEKETIRWWVAHYEGR